MFGQNVRGTFDVLDATDVQMFSPHACLIIRDNYIAEIDINNIYLTTALINNY